MNTPPHALGYVILYVDDVGASLAFYERAFAQPARSLKPGRPTQAEARSLQSDNLHPLACVMTG